MTVLTIMKTASLFNFLACLPVAYDCFFFLSIPFQLILVKFALWCGLSGWWLSPRDCYNFSPTLLILRKLLSNYMCFSLVLCCRQSLNETETDLDVFFESRCVREYLNVFWEATYLLHTSSSDLKFVTTGSSVKIFLAV